MHDCPSLAGKLLRLVREPVEGRVVALDEAGVADCKPVALDGRDGAVARDSLE
jgi:hypothetical protein